MKSLICYPILSIIVSGFMSQGVLCVTMSQIENLMGLISPKQIRPIFQDPSGRFRLNPKYLKKFPTASGLRVLREERYPYPSKYSETLEGQQWEKENERLYAEALLAASISTPKDTDLEQEAKLFLAQFLVNVAADTGSSSKEGFDIPQTADRSNPPFETPSTSINQGTAPPKTSGNTRPYHKLSNQPSKFNIFGDIPESAVSESTLLINESYFHNGLIAKSNDSFLHIDDAKTTLDVPTQSYPESIGSLEEELYSFVVTTDKNSINPWEDNKATLADTNYQSGSEDFDIIKALLKIIGIDDGPRSGLQESTNQLDVIFDHIRGTTNRNESDKLTSMEEKNLVAQVNRLRDNLESRNLTGIVDESLKIVSLQTLGVLVNGLLDIVLCNPVDRWNGNCNSPVM